MAQAMDKIAALLQKIPSKTRVVGFFGLLGVLVILFIWQVHIPKKTQIKQLESEVATIQAKIRENDAKIRKLDELKAETGLSRFNMTESDRWKPEVVSVTRCRAIADTTVASRRMPTRRDADERYPSPASATVADASARDALAPVS